MKTWHENVQFWKKTAPFMFNEERWKRTPAQVSRFIRLLKSKKGMKVLDLCCGPGRVSLEFARRGYDVTGIDHMPHALREAKRRARKEKLSCSFVRGDMRTFRRPNSFDIALSIYTSFGYFKNQSENEKVLSNIYVSLKPGGKLLMELMSRENLKKILSPKGWEERDGTFLLEERSPRRNFRFMENRWIVIKHGRTHEFTLSHHLYGVNDLSRMFRKAGFRNVKTYGKEKRLIVVGVK